MTSIDTPSAAGAAGAAGIPGVPAVPAELHRPVLAWFDQHARDLPWRRPEAGAWGSW